MIGYLDNKASKTIVIGAHYDHLGLNQHHQSTLMNSDGQIHNGADDNVWRFCSDGIGENFYKNKTQKKVNYVFVLFSAEEDGLIGSKNLQKM